MVFIVRYSPGLNQPQPQGKIIRAEDAHAWLEAREILTRAEALRDEILARAESEREQERLRGFREGREAALMEQSRSMVDLVSRAADYVDRSESRMVDIVLDAVQTVVSGFSDQQRVEAVVRNCLHLLRSQKQLILTVHPSQETWLRCEIARLRVDFPAIADIEVHPDAQLAIDACVIESDIGVVEASLSGQLEVLREALSGVLARREADPESVPA